ncbi:MAG: NADH:ubiquinone oxidoreductase, partial [Rhodospirillales bacterium]|nr:NADH:ubiquinone oxidoreductase [Rhodospirillales bacterium]
MSNGGNGSKAMKHRIQNQILKEICTSFNNDKHRMMDILLETQRRFRCINTHSMETIASIVGCTRVEVEGVVSFYTFFSDVPKGEITIHLCDDIIDHHSGMSKVARALEKELGISFGQTSTDGRFSIDYTPCIGMSDQAPAAMINDIILTNLTPENIRYYIQSLKSGSSPEDLTADLGDGNNANDFVRSMVSNNIQTSGEVLLCDTDDSKGLSRALAMGPVAVIDQVLSSGLRGCGGAGFPTGRKWSFAAATKDSERYVFCNADEGEPGTFKDRVLLTERPNLLIEGMTIAAYATGSENGLIYLRGEYVYLKSWLEHVLEDHREKGLLGKNISGQEGFNFDVRIQLGAGAYICGEESALISSCEGLPGEPKSRPPFPVQAGYLGHPTIVNNVETYANIPAIIRNGADWFKGIGTDGCSGTKVFALAGKIDKVGLVEVPMGTSLRDIIFGLGKGCAD